MTKTILIMLGDCPFYYAALMHKIAKQLKKDGHKVIVVATSPYYEKYKGVDFTEICQVYYLSDFLLQEFDQEQLALIELDLWCTYPTYVRDRYFWGHPRNSLDTFRKVVLFFRQIIANHSIDLVVGEPPSNSFLYLANEEFVRKGIKSLGYIPARIPKHFNVYQDVFGEVMLENGSHDEGKFKIGVGPPDYMRMQGRESLTNDVFTRLFRAVKYARFSSVETGNTAMLQLRSFYKNFIWRRMRYGLAKFQGCFVDSFDAEDGVINIFYPLHFRPESSTSVLAKYYEDDIELIKNIAFSLPHNSRLIVKEHVLATGIRNAKFYKCIKMMPNVLVINPEFKTAENLTQFDAVITLTSTVGFEAIQLGIPVYVLGRVFYSTYPGVTVVNSFEQLESAVKGIAKNANEPNADILQRYSKVCFPGQFNYHSTEVLTDKNVDQLCVPIHQLLDTKAD